MHELAITQDILSIALEQARSHNAKRITAVNVTIGRLTGIVDKSVEMYFELLSKDTIAAGATVSFEQPPVKLRCRSCNAVFSPASIIWTCPGCGGQGPVAGNVCRTCEGHGKIQQGPRKLTVRVPCGVSNGSVIHVRGEGKSAPDTGPRGDLTLRVRIQPYW